jgi:integrase
MAVCSNHWDYIKRLQAIKKWKIPESEKNALREYAKEYANGRITGRIGKNIQASVEGALLKLKLPLTYINKPIDKIEKDDLCKFVDCLMQDKIKKKVRKKINGKLVWIENGNYAKKGKDKFLKNLALYLKFRLDDQPEKLAKLLKIVKVILTHVRKEPQSLSYEDFTKIYESCSELCHRYYLLVNAWGGFRASEFHGITASDIYFPDIEKGEEYVRIWIKHDNSKTKGRMITLYGDDCHRIVKQYLDKRKQEGLKHDDPVFEKSHNAAKLWLRRLGNKFSLKLHPHLFRSTCATWLVDKNILRSYTDLVEFFGWSYGSSIPNTYLNRSRIKLKHIDDNVKQSRLEELKHEVEKQKELYRIQQITATTDVGKLETELNEFKARTEALEKSKEKNEKLIKKLIKKIEASN